MSNTLLHIGLIVASTLVAWFFATININLIKPLRMPWRVVVHYVMETIIFGTVFFMYFSWFEAFTFFQTILICLFSLLFFELIAWKYYYKGIPWYYGFWHWWFPSYLIAGVLYGIHEVIIPLLR